MHHIFLLNSLVFLLLICHILIIRELAFVVTRLYIIFNIALSVFPSS